MDANIKFKDATAQGVIEYGSISLEVDGEEIYITIEQRSDGIEKYLLDYIEFKEKLESLGFFEWLKEKGFGSGFTAMILDAQPFDSIERSGYNAIAFRWFREKYGLWFRPDYYDEMKEYNFQGSIHELGKYSAVADIGNHKTPEEAELACLEKLIEIVKFKSE